MLGAVLAEVGKVDEGRRYADASIDVSPLTFFPWFFRSLVDLFDCRAEDAYIRIRDARNRLAAGEPFAGWWVAQMAAFAGREEDAQKEFDDVARMDGGMWSEFSRLFGCALSADTAAVNRQLEGSRVADVAKTDELYPIIIASALARVGDNVGALDWLERAIGWGFTNDRFLLDGNRFFAPLKREPRFDALIARAREKRMAFIA
jgi:hypothetical protein